MSKRKLILKHFKHWLKQVAIALDQLINAVLFGMADETISARCWRNRAKHKCWQGLRMLIDVLFLVFERFHCQKAYRSEFLRKQLPNHYSVNK